MKKFLVLKPLMAVLAVLLSINAWAHDAEIDGICYNLNTTTHTAEVTFKMEYFPEYDGYSNVSNYYSGDVVIPESVEYEGAIYSVTSIGFCAFVQCDGLTSVSIPNSITSVSLQIFEGCPHLTDVFCYAESVPTADDVAFMSVDMENVTLHVPAASINAYMETVPWGDFEKIVALGDAPVIVGDNCIGGIYYNFDEETLTAEVIQGENEYEGDVIIPGSVEYGGSTYVVTSIRENAFNNCKRLTTVTIPKSVTRIGDQAFSSCKGLSDVYCYGEDVPDMLWDVFYDSTPKFKTLHVPDAFVELYADDAQWGTFGTILPLSVESPVSVKVSDIYYLFNGEEQTAVVTRGPDGYEGDVDIPANVTYDGITYAVTEIGNLAFNDCSDLTFVSIPDGVKRIGYRAFWGCKSLEYVDVPESVTSIVDEAFSECENVDLTIPDNVTSIGEFAFYNCYNLTSANLPEGLTEVSAFAFYGCQSLTSVVIPEGVTSIGTYAFARCGDLTSVVIPEGMTIIDVEAFSMCSKLSSVTIPEGVEEIGRWGFASCWSLTSVTLPSSLKYLDYGVFSGCGDLTDVYCYAEEVPTTDADVFLYLPDATLHVPAASIDAYLSESPWSDFYQIASLEDGIPVVIERSWAELIPNGDCETAYEHVFAIAKEVPVDGSDLHQARVVDGVGVDGSKGIEVRASNRLQYAWDNQFWIYEPYELPSGTKYVIEFDYKAAKENETVINTESHALPSNWLGNGIGGVYFTDEWQHFKYESRASDGLRSIAFSLSGNSDANIYYFDNISFKVLADAIEGLEPVYVDDQYPVVEYEDTGEEPDVMELVHVDGISYVVNKNKLVATVTSGGSYEGSVKIPSAFTYYSGEDDAFVEDVMVTEIGSLAFADCRSLLSVTIPEGVAQIKDYAFSGCDAMQRVIIPSTVTTVRHHAFQGCLSLADVYCYATSVPETENDVFASVPVSDVTLHVPAESIDAYKAKEPWSKFGSIIALTEEPINVEDNYIDGVYYSFDVENQTAGVTSGENNYTGEVIIPSSITYNDVTYFVTTIGAESFIDCSGLTSVTIPESVTSIGGYAFMNCSNLTSVSIPESVRSIEAGAFNCCGLTSVNIPYGVTNIGHNTFSCCYNLTSVTIPESVTSIDDYAFSWCNSLTSISIPSSIISLGEGIFYGCSGLKDVYCYAESVPETGAEMFNSVELENATLHVSATSIDTYKETEPWKNFGNIVALPEIVPMEEDTEVTFDEIITAETDLTDVVIDNVYVTLDTEGDDGYDMEEKCIVLVSIVTDEQIETITDKEVKDETVRENYNGLIFAIPAGKGFISITAKTRGNRAMSVKIGDAEAQTFVQPELGVVEIPYTSDKDTYVYVYGAGTSVSAKRRVSSADTENSVLIYSVKWTAEEPTGLDTVVLTHDDAFQIFTPDGKQIETLQKGVNIIKYKNGGTQKIHVK